jgi:hypothetical protein
MRGESRHINSYLELTTNNSSKLKDKTMVLAPGFSPNAKDKGVALLREHARLVNDIDKFPRVMALAGHFQKRRKCRAEFFKIGFAGI